MVVTAPSARPRRAVDGWSAPHRDAPRRARDRSVGPAV